MQNPSAILCALAIIAAQLLYGGLWRPIFAIPALLLIGAAGVVGLGAFFGGGKRSTPSALCILLASALLGWMLFREWQTPDAWTGAASLRLTLGCLLTYLLFATISTSPPSRMLFISILLIAAFIQSTIGIFFFIRNLPGMPFEWLSEQLRLWYDYRSAGRAHGFYLNANHLAWFLNGASLFALSFACWARWPVWAKILALYFAVVCLAGNLLTLSRGGFVGLAAGLGAFLFLSALTLGIGARGKRWVSFAVLIAGLLIIGGAGFLIFSESQMLQYRFTTLLKDIYRESIFEAVLRQMQVNPLWGTGPGSFEVYAKTFRTFTSNEQDFFAHNDIAQLAADFGFVAFGLLVLALIAHFSNGLTGLLRSLKRRMASHIKASSNSVAILIGAISSAVAFLAHSFLDFNAQLPANAFLAAAVFGILANSGIERSAEGWRTKLMSLFQVSGVAACIALGGVLLYLSIKAAPAERDYLLAENALLLGDQAKAISILEHTVTEFPENNRARLLLARAILDRGGSRKELREIFIDAALTLEELEEAEAIFPLDNISLLSRATAQGRLNKFSEAKVTALQVIALAPLLPGGYELYGMASEAEGQLLVAARYYRMAQIFGSTAAKGHLQRVGVKIKALPDKSPSPP